MKEYLADPSKFQAAMAAAAPAAAASTKAEAKKEVSSDVISALRYTVHLNSTKGTFLSGGTK